MLMSTAPTAPTTKSFIRCMPTRTSHSGSITSYAIGNIPTTACARTSPSLTSPHWNSSPVGNFIGERQSVTNLLDEYTSLTALEVRASIDSCPSDWNGFLHNFSQKQASQDAAERIAPPPGR